MPWVRKLKIRNTSKLNHISIGNLLRQKSQRQWHVTVTIALALATLGNVTQIEMILISKASNEGDIALQYLRCYHVQTSPM
jgi:hypothetical protein